MDLAKMYRTTLVNLTPCKLLDILEGHAFVWRLSADEMKNVEDLAKPIYVSIRHVLLLLKDRDKPDKDNVTRVAQISKRVCTN